MHRLFIVFTSAVLFAGCSLLQKDIGRVPTDPSDESWLLAKTYPPDPSEQYASEVQALFDQPYIDPLTRYFQKYRGSSVRASQIAQIREERDRRCEAVAERYASGPLTQQALASYKAGYAFSCPKDVAAYADRLARRQAPAEEEELANTDTEKAPAREEPSQQLKDCYLLTEIRNFSEALKACREPAERGDIQSQTNMALIAYTMEDYAAAYTWARKAAPDSSEAAYLLGRMYTAGKGTVRNNAEAKKWYSEAARQGHTGAKVALDESQIGQ
jgi:hypothetical protein